MTERAGDTEREWHATHYCILQTIELGMTPQQIVLLWLANAQKMGSLIDASRQSPFARGAIANRVIDVIRPRMKGEPKPVIQDAITQAPAGG